MVDLSKIEKYSKLVSRDRDGRYFPLGIDRAKKVSSWQATVLK